MERQSLPNHTATCITNQWSRGETTAAPSPEGVLLARLAADIMNWINASWVLGAARVHGEIDVVCQAGDLPDPRSCLDLLASLIRGTRNGPRVIVTNARPRSENLPHLLCPIEISGGMRAILAIGAPRRGQYSKEDCDLLQVLSSHVGGLLGNQRLARCVSSDLLDNTLRKKEYETACELQDRLLPGRSLRAGNIEYFAETERCGKPGGDFHGFFERSPRRLVAVVGNVSPCGSPAGMMAAAIQGALRLGIERDVDLAAIVSHVNRIAWDLAPENVLGALLCVEVDSANGRVEYVSAGHELAIIVRPGGSPAHRLATTGAMLGLRLQSSYAKRAAFFRPGDALVALSWGAMAPHTGDLSELIRVVRESRHAVVRDPAAYILNSTEFVGSREINRDRTAAVIRFGSRAACGNSDVSVCDRPPVPRAAAA